MNLGLAPVSIAAVSAALPQLRNDFIGLNVSGSALKGESLEHLAEALALLSGAGVTVFVHYGAQEQIDEFVRESPELGEEVRLLSAIKVGGKRYTPTELMPHLVKIADMNGAGLMNSVLRNGGNAQAFGSSLFMGRLDKSTEFEDPETGQPLGNSCYATLPVDPRLEVKTEKLRQMTDYLTGKRYHNGSSAKGRIVIRTFMVTYRGPNGEERAANGDKDNVGDAMAYWAIRRPISPVMLDSGEYELRTPERLHAITVTPSSGLRKGPARYMRLIETVTSPEDLSRYNIEDGMYVKMRSKWQLAVQATKRGARLMANVIGVEDFLPSLFTSQVAFGTTIAPQGVERLTRQFYGQDLATEVRLR